MTKMLAPAGPPLTRAFLVTVAWLVAVSGAVGLLFAASAGTAFTDDDTDFS